MKNRKARPIDILPRGRAAVAPSILSADFANLGREVRAMERAGADAIHVDVMDAHFVPNLTIGAPVVKCLRPVTRLPLDVHLMITDPGDFIDDYAAAGADWLTVHSEAPGVKSLRRMAARIRRAGMSPGVSIKPGTPFSSIRASLEAFDLLLIMSVEPGFGGQGFIRRTIKKMREASAFIRDHCPHVILSVDGGINAKTGRAAATAGVRLLVAGSFLFHSPSYPQAIRRLRWGHSLTM